MCEEVHGLKLTPLGRPVSIRLRCLLSWLLGKREGGASSQCWSIIFNRAWAIEHSQEVRDCSTNPLDAPVFMGPNGKARQISRPHKHAVATLAAAGKVFHSPGAVIKGMELLGKTFIASIKTGNKWTEPLAFRYLHQLQETFIFEKAEVPIYSLSWDATRLSSLDALATAIYNPGLCLAGWCPPQAFNNQIRLTERISLTGEMHNRGGGECTKTCFGACTRLGLGHHRNQVWCMHKNSCGAAIHLMILVLLIKHITFWK